MPIYEYQCDACGHQLEMLQKIAEEPARDCPSCQTPHLRRLISAAGFRLKGSGWYETDFKRDKRRNVAGAEKAPGSDSGKAADSGSSAAGTETSTK